MSPKTSPPRARRAPAIRAAASALASAVVAAVRRRPAFSVAFAVFVGWAYYVGWRNPLGPGQDQHYHLMSASITARWWLGDPAVRALYKFINPTDANTLVYTLLFPFEAASNPVTAWRLGFTTLYFVGYPVACLAALRILRRPPWGAVLAFPLAYVKSWSQGGFIPFVSAAPFFILSIALFHRVIDGAADEPKTRRRMLAGTMAATTLTFFAHGHVYTWLMIVLGLVTVVALARELLVGLPRRGARGLASAFFLGLRALCAVLPSLVFFAAWYWRTHRGDSAATGAVSWAPNESLWENKLLVFLGSFVHVKDDVEWVWVGALLCGILFVLLLAGRPARRELPTAEIATALSLASFFVLPSYIGGQSIGIRQVDPFIWCLPLVVLPALPRGRLKAAAAIALLVALSAKRFDWLGANLIKLQREFAGLAQLAKPCPSAPAELAFATFGAYSTTWHGLALHQAHETYAAMCGLDAPVYDPTEYPHNLLPVRYRGKPPAPITILQDNPLWYAHPNLWKDFDLVLVHGWHPTPRDVDEASKVAVRLRLWNDWQLWHRKPNLDQVP
jgi:hypothetical protein